MSCIAGFYRPVASMIFHVYENIEMYDVEVHGMRFFNIVFMLGMLDSLGILPMASKSCFIVEF